MKRNFSRYISQYEHFILPLPRVFSRSLSHSLTLSLSLPSEMRTPLNCVQIGLELILSQFETNPAIVPDPSSQEILESTYVGCQTAVEILNDCLSYDKLEADDMKLNLSRVTIQTLIEKCVSPFLAQVSPSSSPILFHVMLGSSAQCLIELSRPFLSSPLSQSNSCCC
jgi:signal transduction histidine kinase